METPLLPSHGVSSTNASQKASSGSKKKIFNGDMGNGAPLTGNDVSSNGNAALTKSMSTPASLQTIVRFHHGSNMSLHHRVSMTDIGVYASFIQSSDMESYFGAMQLIVVRFSNCKKG